jgi:hypothetical protein
MFPVSRSIARLPFVTLAIIVVAAGALRAQTPAKNPSPATEVSPAMNFAELWRTKAVPDYTMSGVEVHMAATIPFTTVVKAGRVVAYTEFGRPAPIERAKTVESLITMAAQRLASYGYVIEARRFDPTYGFPRWISWSMREMTDTGGFIEVREFVVDAPRW